MYHRLVTTCIALSAAVLLAQVAFAQGSGQTSVEFAPAVTASLQKTYGANEAGVLRSAILAAVAKEESRAAIPDGLKLKVTVRKVAPTHPTMKQQLDKPSLSPARTRYLGGADLVGELRDGKQQLLATVDYSDFADTLASGSPSLDPWADARVTIDRFAAKLATAWGKLPRT